MNDSDTYGVPESRNGAFQGGLRGTLSGNSHPVTSLQENVSAKFHPDSVLQLANAYATPNGVSMNYYQRKSPFENYQRQLASGEALQNEATP